LITQALDIRSFTAACRGDYKEVRFAGHLEEQRELETDPAYGIEQLALIAWTSISTAKSNPSPALLAIHSLRELLARWSAEAAKDHAEEVRSSTCLP
jgi:uncharacterized membrane protein